MIPPAKSEKPNDRTEFKRGRIHGVIGLTKALLHVDRPSLDVIRGRREVCASCHHAVNLSSAQLDRKLQDWIGVKTSCRVCNCVLLAKTAVASEKCPAGKW